MYTKFCKLIFMNLFSDVSLKKDIAKFFKTLHDIGKFDVVNTFHAKTYRVRRILHGGVLCYRAYFVDRYLYN